jgi:hypothetical protein
VEHVSSQAGFCLTTLSGHVRLLPCLFYEGGRAGIPVPNDFCDEDLAGLLRLTRNLENVNVVHITHLPAFFITDDFCKVPSSEPGALAFKNVVKIL